MGGSGSGRRWRWDSKSTAESQCRIDIRWLKKQGYLVDGFFGSLSWSRGGEKSGSIMYRMETDRMVLIYRHRPRDGEWENVEQDVHFDLTQCNYGGFRKWFKCPHCWRRVAVLYGAGKYFLCRHCHGLAYQSQHDSKPYRLMEKARKIRKRLGGGDSCTDPFPDKPKGMHWKTYYLLRDESENANRLGWIVAAQTFGPLVQGDWP